MKLLIVTQAVDQEDPVLGFFHRWLEAFSKRFDRIEVVCLREGKHALPGNVHVHSLGKEKGAQAPLVYAMRFLSLVWRLRREYDTVLVHMNPEYVMLAGWLWKLLGKRIALWYNHPHAGFRLAVAATFADRIFFTSPYAATAKYKKAKRMPAGIDTDLFAPRSGERNRRLIYMQGRIAPSKHVDMLLKAMRALPSASVVLVGPEDPTYGKMLRTDFADLIASSALSFAGPVPNNETPERYARAGVSVNLAAAGHFDKSALESMACGTPVITSSKAFADLISAAWIVPEHDVRALATALERMLALPQPEFDALAGSEREAVMRTQSLKALSDELVKAL